MEDERLGVQVERFLGIKHNLETRLWYAKYLAPMVNCLGVERCISAITRADAESYWRLVQARKSCWVDHPMKPTEKRALSPTTRHNHLRAARTFWNEMVRQKLVDYNPFDHLKSPRDTRPVEMKAITAEDLRAIWEEAKRSSKRDVAIVTVIATSGLRAGELVSMCLSRLDLRNGTAWVEGKRGWRKVFLGQASVQAVTAYMRERSSHKDDALWLSTQGVPLTTDGVRQLVDRLAERAQVKGIHNLHAFRHRVAQAWLDKGINAEIVSQALGHADVNVTLLIYSNQDEKRVRSAMLLAEMYPFEDLNTSDSLELSRPNNDSTGRHLR
jgi:site-specific recombinase XerD